MFIVQAIPAWGYCMFYLSNQSIESAIQELHRSGTHEYFRTFLTLKAHGLTLGSKDYIPVTTTNTVPGFNMLFGVEGLDPDKPFYNPLRNEFLTDDTPRGTVQTHVKKFLDGATKTKMSWLEGSKSAGDQRGDTPWYVRFSGAYPGSLGSGAAGLAEKDGYQITIHRPSFVIWMNRNSSWDSKPDFERLWGEVRKTLNLTDVEIDLLFTADTGFDPDPFTETQPNRDELVQWILNEVGKGSSQRVLVAPRRKAFSDTKMKRIIAGSSTTETANRWWEADDVRSDALSVLDESRALMLVGAPGTGKTRLAFQLAKEIIGEDDTRIHAFQFHASYAYEDFIEALQPSDSDILQFTSVKKRFALACEAAINEPQVVIIDELNRADVSKVFGEAFMLVERSYRAPEYAIPYLHRPKEKFWIPPDLYIIATLNNLDRSTYDIDFAFRRRFGQVEMLPSFRQLEEVLRSAGCEDEDFIRILMSAFSQIQGIYPLGHAYFVSVRDRDTLKQAYGRRIRPTIEAYLGEYRQEQYNQIDSIIKRVCDVSTWLEYIGVEE